MILQTKSQTYQGVVWTVQDDMTILANGITTADNRIYIGKVDLKAGRTYYLSGSPKAPTLYYWRLQLRKEISGVVYSIWDDGEGAEFSIPASQEGTWDVAIRYAPNASIPNIVFSPQVALKANTPYAPYAMTNRELTKVIDLSDTVTLHNQDKYSVGSKEIKRCGKILSYRAMVHSVNQNVMPSGQPWITIMSGLPRAAVELNAITSGKVNANANPIEFYMLYNGVIAVRGGTTGEDYTISHTVILE